MIYVFIALIFYAAAMLLAAAASRNMNTNLAAAITNVMSAILPIAVIVPLFSKKAITEHKFGFLMAVLSGICIGVFALAISKSYTLNKVAVVLPVIYGGVIVLTAIGGSLFFKEKLTLLELMGLIVICSGLGLLIYARIVAK